MPRLTDREWADLKRMGTARTAGWPWLSQCGWLALGWSLFWSALFPSMYTDGQGLILLFPLVLVPSFLSFVASAVSISMLFAAGDKRTGLLCGLSALASFITLLVQWSFAG